MWDRQELKMRGKMAFRRNYGSAVAVALLMQIISIIFGGGNSSRSTINYGGDYRYDYSYTSRAPGMEMIAGLLGAISLVLVLIGILLSVFVGNILEVGGKRFFILNQSGRPGIGVMLDGFRSGHYGNIAVTMFLRDLYIGLWSLLLIIPGIVKSYEYRMVPYILAENPGMDRREAFQISKQMMEGEKMETFVMDLSFLGWEFLSVFTCGLLSVFYVAPYKEASFAELYSFNKMKAYQAGYIK